MLACEQSISKFKNFGFPGKFKKQLIALIIDEVLGVIEQNSTILAIELPRKFGKPVFIARKEIFDND